MRTEIVRRMAIWVSVGVLVAIGWGYYFAAVNRTFPVAPNMHTLATLTQPAVAALLFFDPASRISFYGSVLLNAATYGLLGFLVEIIRRSYRPALSSVSN